MRRKVTGIIEEWASSGRSTVLMISGARQTGKTYAAQEFCRANYEHHLFVDFTTDEEARGAFDGTLRVDDIVLRLSAIYPEVEFVPHETILFLDEIQECPNARTALKSFALDGRYRVIASGSLLGLKLGDVRLLPMGYVEEVRLGPMDFEEFLWALGVPEGPIEAVKGKLRSCEPIDESLYETFSRYHGWYLVVGGMPGVVSEFVGSRVLGPVRREQRKILDGYIDDVRRYADPRDRVRIEACLEAMPGILAKENKKFMFAEVREDGIGYRRGFEHYAGALSWLDMAGVSLRCLNLSEPHMPLEERIIPNSFKLYMLDTGILMTTYDPALAAEVLKGNADVNRGAIAENAVAVALSLQGRRLYHFSRTGDRIGVDFVTIVDGRVCSIEVRSGSNRSCRSLNKVMGSHGTAGIMFETRNSFEDDKGVRHYPLFAASFMDSIDPPREIAFDEDGVGGPGDRLGSRSRATAHHRGAGIEGPTGLPAHGPRPPPGSGARPPVANK